MKITRRGILLSIFLICEFHASIANAQVVLRPNNSLTINSGNSMRVNHETAVTIHTSGGTAPITLTMAPDGYIIQETTQAAAADMSDPATPPPHNCAVYVGNVGPALFTLNLGGIVTASASMPSTPTAPYSHYSPALYLAGNTTLNHTGRLTGDIWVNYSSTGHNNVRINLGNNSRVSGNIFTSAIFPLGSHTAASVPLGTVQVDNNYTTEGSILGFSNITLDPVLGSTINIHHELMADQISLQNNGRINLYAGGTLRSSNPIQINNNVWVQGGNIVGPMVGAGSLNFASNFITTGNIIGPQIRLEPGATFVLTHPFVLQSDRTLELTGVSALRIYGGTLRTSVSDDGAGRIDVEGPFALGPGVNLKASTIAVNAHGGLNGVWGVLKTEVSNTITGFNDFTIYKGGSAVLSSGATGNSGAKITNHGDLIIKEGTYKAADFNNTGRVQIQGGTFETPIRNTGSSSLMSIAAGTFKGPIEHMGGTLSIAGGSFKAPISVHGGELALHGGTVDAQGGIVNNGRVALNGTTNLLGNYTQNSGGTLLTNIKNADDFGRLQVTGNALIHSGSTLQIAIPQNTTIKEGDTFDVVTANGGSISKVHIVTAANSPFKFHQDTSSGNLRVKAERSYYLAQKAITPNAGTVAMALESLRFSNADPKINALLSSLDNAPESSISNALTTIAPNHTHGIFYGGLATSGAVISKAEQRMTLGRFGQRDLGTGYTSGDLCCDGYGSFAPVFFVNGIKQKDTPSLNGFLASTEGFGILADTSVMNCLQLGIGGIYAGTRVRTDKDSGRTLINSWEGVAYAGLHGRNAFIDSTFLVGRNWYHIRRELVLGVTQTAFSKHKGMQYSAKVLAGYDMPFCGFAATPIFSYLYSHLHQNSFLEDGFISRFTAAQNTHLAQAGAGLKLSFLEESDRYIPEIHVQYLQDLNSPSLQVSSEFTAGGPSFTVLGPNNTHKSSVNIGGSLTAFLGKCVLLTGTYDFEGKKTYRSHSGTIRVRWIF